MANKPIHPTLADLISVNRSVMKKTPSPYSLRLRFKRNFTVCGMQHTKISTYKSCWCCGLVSIASIDIMNVMWRFCISLSLPVFNITLSVYVIKIRTFLLMIGPSRLLLSTLFAFFAVATLS